jgi:iron(III) transport system substrate-binding protein
MSKIVKIMVVLLLLASAVMNVTVQAASAEEKQYVMLYSSLKDSQLAAIREGFMKKYPNVTMDYYTAGTGNVMTKLATEHQSVFRIS